MQSTLPPNLVQRSGLIAANGAELKLKDGSTTTADAIIFCTGYEFKFPFLDEKSGITVDDNFIYPVYQHVINANHPSMAFIGLLNNTGTLHMMYSQVE